MCASQHSRLPEPTKLPAPAFSPYALQARLGTTLRELEVDTLTGQPLVHLGVSVEPVVHTTSLLLIEHDLEDLAAVLTSAHTLSDNLHWVDEVCQDGIVDSGESARTWALLRLRSTAAVAALGAG